MRCNKDRVAHFKVVNCFFLERIQFEWVLEKATKVNG